MATIIWSVTCDWEDHREGQWTETRLVLASDPAAAAAAAADVIEERTGVVPSVADVHVFTGEIPTRVIATLSVDATGATRWISFR